MGRDERPLEPSKGTLGAFASELRKLRRVAGNPSYRRLSRRAGYSASALSTAASGRTVPSLSVTLAYVGGGGGYRGRRGATGRSAGACRWSAIGGANSARAAARRTRFHRPPRRAGGVGRLARSPGPRTGCRDRGGLGYRRGRQDRPGGALGASGSRAVSGRPAVHRPPWLRPRAARAASRRAGGIPAVVGRQQ